VGRLTGRIGVERADDDDRQIVGVIAAWEQPGAVDAGAGWLRQTWAVEMGKYALDLLRFEARRLGTTVRIGKVRVSWGARSRRFRHREPWRGLTELAALRAPDTAGRLEWLMWHSYLYGISVETCDTDQPAPHLAIEVAAAYDVTTPTASVEELRVRATRCAQLAFDDFGADLARAYACNHFNVRPSLPVAEYLTAASDLPSLLTLARNRG